MSPIKLSSIEAFLDYFGILPTYRLMMIIIFCFWYFDESSLKNGSKFWSSGKEEILISFLFFIFIFLFFDFDFIRNWLKYANGALLVSLQ